MVLRLLLCDAQTSGGLLLVVSPERALPLLESLRESRTPAATIIGEIVTGADARIQVIV
jgi:selenophosphate synthase